MRASLNFCAVTVTRSISRGWSAVAGGLACIDCGDDREFGGGISPDGIAVDSLAASVSVVAANAPNTGYRAAMAMAKAWPRAAIAVAIANSLTLKISDLRHSMR